MNHFFPRQSVSAQTWKHIFSIVILSVVAGSITTLWGYTYGSGNQIEQLPIVLRAIDSNYLTHDFFTNASASFGPRLYFARFLAFMSQGLSLSVVYLLLTICSNISIGIISALFVRDLFDGDILAALSACAGVLSLKTFWLGASNTTYQNYLDPSLLIFPLLLLAIWAAIRGRVWISSFLAGVASLFHPLMGLETGALLIGLFTLFSLYNRVHSSSQAPHRSQAKQIIVSLLIFSIFAIPSLLPYLSESQISSAQFVEIVAYLRHPHHYLPSTFGFLQYAQAFAFLIAAAIAFTQARQRNKRLHESSRFIIGIFISLAILCIGGTLFVEVIHSRLWTTAQLFRLLFIVKWIGLMMITGNFAQQCKHNLCNDRISLVTTTIALISPPTMMFSHIYQWLCENFSRCRSVLEKSLSKIIFLLGLVAVLFIYHVELRVWVLFGVFMLMGFAFTHFNLTKATILNLLGGVFLFLIIQYGNFFLPPKISSEIQKPIIHLDNIDDDSSDVAAFARQNTPADALFIVPPKMGEFRFTAERAIVVDFKAFPFQDAAMLEWQHRLYACYGAPPSIGWQAESDMTVEYRHIQDEKLKELQDEFGFSYAVLFMNTETQFPVLFEGENYKIVSLQPSLE